MTWISACRIMPVRQRLALLFASLALLFAVPLGAQLPDAQVESTVESQSTVRSTALNEVIEEAKRNNPEIAAAYHGWRAVAYAPRQVSALPDTQVTVQHMSVGNPRPFAGFNNSEFAYMGLGVSQDIPFPGKRELRGKVASLEASVLREEVTTSEQKIIEELKLTYFQLAYLQQTLEILTRNDQLLQSVQQVVDSRYRLGQGSQQDLLRAQLQHTKLLQQIAMQHQQVAEQQAKLKELLGRSQDSSDIITEPLQHSPFNHSDMELLASAQSGNPAIRAQERMVQQQAAQAELARRGSKPDFNAQYMWQHTSSNFRDYYMASFSARLPNRGRQSAELAAAVEGEKKAKQEFRSTLQQVQAEIKKQYVVAKGSEQRLKIYSEGLLPQSDTTFQSGLKAYQSNRQEFQSLLSALLDTVNLQLEYRHEILEHESAIARLESLTGMGLR